MRNTVMASWRKIGCSPVCLYVSKVYQINGSIVGWSKEDKNFGFTYIHGYMCVYISDGL